MMGYAFSLGERYLTIMNKGTGVVRNGTNIFKKVGTSSENGVFSGKLGSFKAAGIVLQPLHVFKSIGCSGYDISLSISAQYRIDFPIQGVGEDEWMKCSDESGTASLCQPATYGNLIYSFMRKGPCSIAEPDVYTISSGRAETMGSHGQTACTWLDRLPERLLRQLRKCPTRAKNDDALPLAYLCVRADHPAKGMTL